MANKGLFPSIEACLDAHIATALRVAESIDGKAGTNPFWVQSDREAYWMCASTWYYLILDSLGRASADNLLWGYQQVGLFKMIEMGEEFASLYLRSLSGGAITIPHTMFSDVFASVDFGALDEAEVCKIILQSCRYAKRFALSKPTCDDELDTRSIEKFVKCAKKCSYINSHWDIWPGPTIMSFVRDEMYDVIAGDGAYLRASRRRRTVLSDPAKLRIAERGSFSSGSIRLDSGRTTNDIGVKYSELVSSGIKAFDSDDSHWNQYLLDITNSSSSAQFYLPRRCVKVMCVPKDYHNRRIIAPEPSFMNWFGHATRSHLLSLCETFGGSIPFMDPEDQSINSGLAKVGSLSGSWDTLDLSSASDSIPRQLFFSVFPMPLRQLVAYSIPDWYELPDGTLHTCSMLATSGNVLTPLLQSIFFLSLGRVACRLSGLDKSSVYVYNDDIVVDARASETLCELIESFGGTVNSKKSYCAGPYRESCGGEYYNGTPVGPIYWPRQPLPADDALKVKFLTTLQHRLFAYPITRSFVTRVCMSYMPDMTYSHYGADCDDLWASYLSIYDDLSREHMHLVVQNAPRKVGDVEADLFGFRAYQLDHYERFLQDGPVFATELDRLLHVSSPISLVGDYAHRKIEKWVMERPLIRLNW